SAAPAPRRGSDPGRAPRRAPSAPRGLADRDRRLVLGRVRVPRPPAPVAEPPAARAPPPAGHLLGRPPDLAADLHLAAVELPGACLPGALAADHRRLQRLRSPSDGGRDPLRLLRRTAGRGALPDELRRPVLPDPDQGPRLLLVRDHGPVRRRGRLRAADLR